MTVLNPNFMQFANIRNIFGQVGGIGIVALGAMVVITSGGIDFTAGFGVALCGVVGGAFFLANESNALLFIITCIATGIIIGIVNGLLITRLKLQPFIITLSMMAVIQGVMQYLSEGRMIHLTRPSLQFIGSGMVFDVIPFTFVLFAVMSCIAAFIMRKTKMGAYVISLGSNEEALKLSGVNVGLCRFLVYVFAGLCTGIGAVVMVTRIATVTPSISGNILLDAIASTVIGGTSMSGGRSSVIGTIIGVLIIGIIGNALTMLSVPPRMQDVVKGIIIFIALYLDIAINRYQNKRILQN